MFKWGELAVRPIDCKPTRLVCRLTGDVNFEWPYLRNGWSDTLHVWSRVGFSGSVDRMYLQVCQSDFVYGWLEGRQSVDRLSVS